MTKAVVIQASTQIGNSYLYNGKRRILHHDQTKIVNRFHSQVSLNLIEESILVISLLTEWEVLRRLMANLTIKISDKIGWMPVWRTHTAIWWLITTRDRTRAYRPKTLLHASTSQSTQQTIVRRQNRALLATLTNIQWLRHNLPLNSTLSTSPQPLLRVVSKARALTINNTSKKGVAHLAKCCSSTPD